MSQVILRAVQIVGFGLVLAACATTDPVDFFINTTPRPGSMTAGSLGTVTIRTRKPEAFGAHLSGLLARNLETEFGIANVFGDDLKKQYKLAVRLEHYKGGRVIMFAPWHAAMGVRYELRDPSGALVYRRVIESTSDINRFSGKDAQRVNMQAMTEHSASTFVRDLASQLARERPASQVAIVKPATAPVARPTISKPVATVVPGFGAYHALIIGNNAYQNLPALLSAANDAQELANILQSKYGFKTRLLIDADRTQIVSALNDYRKTLTRNDNLLIYYAGHGWVDEAADEGYWLPVDAEEGNTVNWVSNASLTSTIRAMQAKHVMIVADSCYSGKLTRGVSANIRSPGYLKRMAGKRARTALTSGGLEPVLDAGGTGGHSVFASALFGALNDNDGVMDMSQMFSVVRRNVALEADQVPEYGDIRRAGHKGGDFVFVRSQ